MRTSCFEVGKNINLEGQKLRVGQRKHPSWGTYGSGLESRQLPNYSASRETWEQYAKLTANLSVGDAPKEVKYKALIEVGMKHVANEARVVSSSAQWVRNAIAQLPGDLLTR